MQSKVPRWLGSNQFLHSAKRLLVQQYTAFGTFIAYNAGAFRRQKKVLDLC